MASITQAALEAIRRINRAPCNEWDEKTNWDQIPDIIQTIISEITVTGTSIKRATATADWFDPGVGDPYVDATDNDTAASIRAYLPRIGGGDPNVRSGDQFFYKEYDDGTGTKEWCDGDYMDDKIGTMKFWSLASGSIPPGWVVMNGVANAAGSNINLIDKFIRGGNVAGTVNPAEGTGESPAQGGTTSPSPSNVDVLETGSLTTSQEQLTITHDLNTDELAEQTITSSADGAQTSSTEGTVFTIDPETVPLDVDYVNVEAGNNQQAVEDVTALPHTHGITNPTFSHEHDVLDHTHDVTVPAHQHDITGTITGGFHDHTIPPHDHPVDDPEHTHDFLVPAHSHDDPGIPANVTLIPIERLT